VKPALKDKRVILYTLLLIMIQVSVSLAFLKVWHLGIFPYPIEVMLLLVFALPLLFINLHFNFFEKVYAISMIFSTSFLFLVPFIKFNYMNEHLFLVCSALTMLLAILVAHKLSFIWERYLRSPYPISSFVNNLMESCYDYRKEALAFLLLGFIISYISNSYMMGVNVIFFLLLFFSRIYFILSLVIFLVVKIISINFVRVSPAFSGSSSFADGLLIGIIINVILEAAIVRMKTKTTTRCKRYLTYILFILIIVPVAVFFNMQLLNILYIVIPLLGVFVYVTRLQSEVILTLLPSSLIANRYINFLYNLFYTLFHFFKNVDYVRIGQYLRNSWYIINIFSLSNIGGMINLLSEEDSDEKRININISNFISHVILAIVLGYIVISLSSNSFSVTPLFPKMNIKVNKTDLTALLVGLSLPIVMLLIQLRIPFINSYALPIAMDMPDTYILFLLPILITKFLAIKFRVHLKNRIFPVYFLYGYMLCQILSSLFIKL